MPPPLSRKPGKPGPVLPAMGLHSFHADSPPFMAGATEMEPDHLSLDTAADPDFDAAAYASNLGDGVVPDFGESDDEMVIRARSRRLVSGYRFGNPPSPVATMRVPQSGLSSQVIDGDAEAAAHDAHDAHDAPSHDSDSPPLTEPDASPRVSDSEVLVGAVEAVSLNDTKPSISPPPLEAPPTRAVAARRRSERKRFDALTGLYDGEADEETSATRAEHGSEAYLRGERGYHFPKHRLRKTMKDESKIPLVIVACGSFSPPTYLHLRMFEMAKDEIVESQTYEIMAGYYSPVSSYYKKAGLAPAIDRVRMCELAVEHTSTWLMVDPWEAGQPEYQRTAVVLDHFDEMLNGGPDGAGGVHMPDGTRRKYKIMLLAGGDLIESFGEPGVWSEPDLHIILGRFGCLIVERAGSDVWAFLLSHDILYHHRRNVIVIKQLIYNDISSTKVRLFVRRGMSIKYLLPNSVIQYIHELKLYREPDRKPEYRVDG